MNNVSRPSVAIILLNWNSFKDTYECLKSLETLFFDTFHVYVVDNDSQDGSYDRLKNSINLGEFKVDVTLIQSGGNLGFAGGNNIGMKKAYEEGYRYIWLLNNDTTVDHNALIPLIEAMEADEKVGIVGSKIYFDGTDLLWFAGGEVNRYSGATHHTGYKEKDKGQYDEIKPVEYIVGCSLLFRRELIDSIGYLEEDYFLYFEDTDFNIRAAKEGWKIYYIPESIVHHKVSSSFTSESVAPFFAYYNIRNSYLMVRRTQRKLAMITAFMNLAWKVIKHHLRILIRNQDSKKTRSFLIFKGALDALRIKSGKYS